MLMKFFYEINNLHVWITEKKEGSGGGFDVLMGNQQDGAIPAVFRLSWIENSCMRTTFSLCVWVFYVLWNISSKIHLTKQKQDTLPKYRKKKSYGYLVKHENIDNQHDTLWAVLEFYEKKLRQYKIDLFFLEYILEYMSK